MNEMLPINYSSLKVYSLTSVSKKTDVIWAGLFFFRISQ